MIKKRKDSLTLREARARNVACPRCKRDRGQPCLKNVLTRINLSPILTYVVNATATANKRDRQMTNTAAGQISVISQGRAASRGNTTVWLGRLSDGRFVVTSRFQWEVKTKDFSKAQEVFNALCG